MKIAAWSVNCVNRRLAYLLHWLEKRRPDIVALQKIRVPCRRQEDFPTTEIEEAGYRIETLFADNERHSVATLIRRKSPKDEPDLKVRQRGLSGRETDGRVLTVETDRVRVSSVYAPYAPCGSSRKDQIRRSIQTKVKWLECLRQQVAEQLETPKPTFLCGDFNVAPDGESEPDRLNRSPEEQDALNSLCALGFVDLYRDFHGDGRSGFNSGTPYTKRPNTRLHLVLGTRNVASHVKSACVDIEYRGPIEDLPGVKWAPGAPVVIEIDDSVI